VGICAERGLEMVVGLLGIMKAGGAYVPLDPGYPEERLRCILEDSMPVTVLTQESLAGKFAGIGPVIALLDFTPTSVWNHLHDTNLTREATGVTAENLAYVIYTSGSTGLPKGVVVPHRAISRLVLNNRYAKFEASDRVAFASNPAFDATTMEVWAPLLNGGSVVVIEQSVLLEPARFGQTLKRHGVNILWLTVGLFNQYSDSLAEEFSTLRYLIVGGDALDPHVIARLLKGTPPQHLLNGYGPTETTTFATTYEIKVVTENAQSIPIGRPIGNTQIYILDEEWEPVPVGVAGEIHIGGDGVGRGYLKRPELTAERFVADPFSGEEGTRMYRTGDVGRWRGDGNIEFLGRNDEQVKIRGFRIELGEIEARLSEHEGVQEAVVLAREDMPGDKRLVAYYTSSPVADTEQEGVGAEQLRVHLSATLPEYMVPAAYVRMERMPLTANGKLDRKSLPAPDGLPSRNARSFRTAEEQILCSLFAEVLNVEDVGVDDNFFESGGHSLSAIRLVTRIRSELGLNISLRTLLEAPTVAGLAKLKNVETNRDSFATILPIKARGTLPPLFLVHAASGLSWYYAGLLKYVEPERPIYGLQARNFTAPEISEQTVEEMASYYADEILKVQPTGRYHLGGWSIGGLLAHAIATELQRRGGDVALLSLFDPTPPFIQQNRPNAVFPNETRIAADFFGEDLKDEPNLSAIYKRLYRDGRVPVDLSESHFSLLIKNVKGAHHLVEGFVPKIYIGKVLLFVATAGREDAESLSEAWKTYVNGNIEVYPIACVHEDMMNTGPLGEIGPLLASELGKP
jgi:amino acid adenylation domain-containing protein